MKIFKFDSKKEPQSIIDQIDQDMGYPCENSEYVGQPNHKQGYTKSYTEPIELEDGWGIIADAVTRKYVGNEPVEGTLNNDEDHLV